MMNQKPRFETSLVHGGQKPDPLKAVVTPIYQTSTFAFENAQNGADCFAGESDGYIYTRLGNPTVRALEDAVAILEGGFGGIALASGMGAVTTVYMSFLSAGAHIVSTDAVYGASRSVLENHLSRFGVQASFVDTSDLARVEAALRPNTRLLYVETPANPTITLTDISACAELCRERGIRLVVDNTFCSPYLQRPLELGADVVLHSVTKFINGHADVVGGVIVAKTATDHTLMYNVMTSLGPSMDPHQAFLVSRGLKTLSLRLERAQANATMIADYLEKHPAVAWVRYPGLASHPQRELALKQQSGPGAMISFGLKGGFEAGRILMDNVHLAALAVSLGGVETLIQHPASMTHAKVSAEAKLLAGITDDLVRYSVGIEAVEDLIADLDQALSRIPS